MVPLPFILLAILGGSVPLLLIFYFVLDRWYRKPRIANVHQKCVFITGTNTGFGRMLSLVLDKKGVKVYAGCYTQQGADQLRQEASDRLRTLQIDVTDRKSLEEARSAISGDLGPEEGLWGLVNNAGIGGGTNFDFSTVDDYKEAMEVNFFGVINATEVFRALVIRGRGRIVNMVSALGRVTVLGEPYTASKHALEPYSDGLRRSMRAFGVHVSIIEPGFYRTNITNWSTWERQTNRMWEKLPDEVKDDYGREYKHQFLQFLKGLNSTVDNGLNTTEHVPRAVIHALFSTRPKARYVCGYDGIVATRLAPFVPDWLADAIMCRLLRYNTIKPKRST